MLNVALDVSSLDHEKISGVGIYVKHLSYQLGRLSDVQVSNVFKPSRWMSREWIRHHTNAQSQPYLHLYKLLCPSQVQVFHGPDFRLPHIYGLPKVVTVHDLAFYDPGMTSEKFSSARRQLMEHVLKNIRPERIIAVSQFTKQKICERFPQWQDQIRVVHLGADHLGLRLKSHDRVYDFPYFLFVGNLEARKNVCGLIRAFEIFAQKNKDVRLVLVGKPGFDYESIEKAWQQSESRERILLPGFVTNTQLSALYAHAIAFVLPSFHEGFGIPVLEAMGSGCPVITSRGTSTEEVAGAAGLLIDPHNLEELAAAMVQLYSSNDLREKFITLGRQRILDFRWQNCAQQTLNVYRETVARA